VLEVSLQWVMSGVYDVMRWVMAPGCTVQSTAIAEEQRCRFAVRFWRLSRFFKFRSRVHVWSYMLLNERDSSGGTHSPRRSFVGDLIMCLQD